MMEEVIGGEIVSMVISVMVVPQGAGIGIELVGKGDGIVVGEDSVGSGVEISSSPSLMVYVIVSVITVPPCASIGPCLVTSRRGDVVNVVS